MTPDGDPLRGRAVGDTGVVTPDDSLTRRVVIVWCEGGSEQMGRRTAIGVGEPWVLTLDGMAERMSESLDATDMTAVADHYGADIAVVAPKYDFCIGVIADGPQVGRRVYTIREEGATVSVDGQTYRVVDPTPDEVGLSFVVDPEV